jgi:hypothetical protein
VQLLPAIIALLDDLPDRQHLVAWNLPLFVRLRERLLHLTLFGAGNLRRDGVRNHPSLHSGDELFLASLEQHANGRYIFNSEIDFFGDLGVRITAVGECTDRTDQLERPLATPRQILDEAHDVAVLFGRLDQEGRDFGLTEGNERFEPALSAYEVIARTTRRLLTVIGFFSPRCAMLSTNS